MAGNNWTIPDGWEDGLADEVSHLLSQGKSLEQSETSATPSSNAFEQVIHPYASAFIGAFDAAEKRLDADLPRQVVQFCHCLSQVIAGKLMEHAAIMQLPVEVYAALAYSAIGGWQAGQEHASGRLQLPPPDIDPLDASGPS